MKVGNYVRTDNGVIAKVNKIIDCANGKQVFRLEFDVDGLKGHMLCESKHIESIVTHEQFESMEYKVVENDN